ncbi:hypothetical protein EIN_310120 [Entamoeba invadens IP1]|uniref:Defective in cullin neddylation protein n=1 Tax=Entamoeba invadens IP1 TaxID=370355 RepID=A0A0A1TWC5_ENTIV|nr:hypothetical protein EIN_310120 [Entamoeba invadens IP1]ELP84979.1 hypothetical protein EIN_310120 [Entamoeba invadens IP1]|eukprot:XP_004184325.1 hypothetical protein EIN_310120 [Entamoeba invadens IP1]
MGARQTRYQRRSERRSFRKIEVCHSTSKMPHISWEDPILSTSSTHMLCTHHNDQISIDFTHYATEGVIQPLGLSQMLLDLGIHDVETLDALWVAYMFSAKDFTITAVEFRKCLERFGATSLEKFKKMIPKNQLEDKDIARKLFVYAFECNTGYRQTRIEKIDAIYLLELFFGKENPQVIRFIQFLNLESTKKLTKDDWNNLYDFIQTVDYELLNYDDSGNSSWPLVFDTYVEYTKQHTLSN